MLAYVIKFTPNNVLFVLALGGTIKVVGTTSFWIAISFL